jgi:cytochrome c5
MKEGIVIFLLTVTAAGFAYAASGEALHSIKLPNIPVELKAGEGKETTTSFCSVCHSPDYITMQPAFSKAQWAAEVNKMIKVMGAPIPEKDAQVIIDYLATEYGTGK